MQTAHPSRGHPASNHSAAVLVRHMIFGFWNTTHGASRRFAATTSVDKCNASFTELQQCAPRGSLPASHPAAPTPRWWGPWGATKWSNRGPVGTPTVERVSRKRQYGHLLRGEFAHFVLACRGSLAPSPEGIPTPSLRNVAKCAFPKHVRSYTEGVDGGRRAPI